MTFSTSLCKTQSRNRLHSQATSNHKHLTNWRKKLTDKYHTLWCVCTCINGRSPLKNGGYAFPPEEWQITGPKCILFFPTRVKFLFFKHWNHITHERLPSCPESKAGYEYLQCIVLVSRTRHFPVWDWLFPELLWKRESPERPKLSSKRRLPHIPIMNCLLFEHQWGKKH